MQTLLNICNSLLDIPQTDRESRLESLEVLILYVTASAVVFTSVVSYYKANIYHDGIQMLIFLLLYVINSINL